MSCDLARNLERGTAIEMGQDIVCKWKEKMEAAAFLLFSTCMKIKAVRETNYMCVNVRTTQSQHTCM